MTVKVDDKNKENEENIQNFFEIFFSFNNIENNLIYLNISFKSNYNINPDFLENLNILKY